MPGGIGFGGAERQMALILNNLHREVFSLKLCLFNQTSEAIPETVEAHDLEKKSRWSFGNLVLRLSRLIREEKPDIVYSRVQYANSIASLAIKLSGNKRVKHIANEETILSQQLSELPRGRAVKLWIRNRYRTVDCVIAPCEASGQDLISRFGVPESKVQVIYNSIDLEALRSLEVAASNAALSHEKPKIISVGSLRSVKGHRFLLRALKEILRRYPDCQLEILGEGAERAFLTEYAKQLDIASHVHMPGIQVPYAPVAEADVFVLPSLREGVPTALLEAMALKVPVVASSVGGVPEVVEDGKTGFLVRPGDWQEIADRVVDLLNDRNKRELFVANSLRVVAEKFDIKKNVKKLEMLFSDCCSA
jgi:glycosyltransferase involved in cell wall biosynthesis